MGKYRDIWSQKQAYEKILSILGFICSISIIIFATMQILDIWENSIYVFEPLLGMLMLIQAIQNWNKNKTASIFSLCAAMLILVFTIFIFLTR